MKTFFKGIAFASVLFCAPAFAQTNTPLRTPITPIEATVLSTSFNATAGMTDASYADFQFANDGYKMVIVDMRDTNEITPTSVDVTIYSVADEYGRKGDVTYQCANGELCVFPSLAPEAFNAKGGADKGKVYVNLSANGGSLEADIKIGVVHVAR